MILRSYYVCVYLCVFAACAPRLRSAPKQEFDRRRSHLRLVPASKDFRVHLADASELLLYVRFESAVVCRTEIHARA